MSQESFQNYVSRMDEIHRLSSLDLDRMGGGADVYTEELRDNFQRIGALAMENRRMLDQILYPVLDSSEPLTKDQVREFQQLGSALLNAHGLENLDLPVLALLTQRLVKDAEGTDQTTYLLRELDTQLSVYYALLNMTQRLSSHPRIAEGYRRKGFAVGEQFLRWAEKDKFLTIEDMECREMVLINARYQCALYEGVAGHPEENQRNLDLLELSLAQTKDPFYREAVPNFDWRYQEFRALEYIARVTDYLNLRGFNQEQLNHIRDRSVEMEALFRSDPEYYETLAGDCEVRLLSLRNRYLAGEMDTAVYKQKLLEVYQRRRRDCYDVDGINENLLTAAEFLCVVDRNHLTAQDRAELVALYQNICAYIFHKPSTRVLSYMLEFISAILRLYVEFPGGPSFEDMCLRCLAALHPPTYIHTQMVGQITVCLAEHLMDIRPELFIGLCRCKTVQEVSRYRFNIVKFCYQSALCHDFGKLSMIDTIFVYGRNLLDMEFDIIRQHPRMGHDLLMQFDSMRGYADVALGHHRWYDDSRGYPEDFETAKSPAKVVIDLVACADCMDAATDSIGRSYRKAKTLDQFVEEVRQGSGTRYAPWLMPLLEEKEIRRDLEYLLNTGRRLNYRNAYLLLKNVQEQGKGFNAL